MKTSVSLSDEDLSRLANSSDDAVRVVALAACARIIAPTRWPSVPSHVAALISDIISEAKQNGRLIWRGVYVSRCRYCGATSKREKLKRRKNPVEVMVRGVETADRFVIISGHISVGACRVCVEHAQPLLRTELATFPVQLPQALQSDGPVYQRWDRCRCKKCEWSGHEGQLGKLRTLMNDGWYPGTCPSCGVERRPLGVDPFERLYGFDVVEHSSPKERP